MDCYLSQFCLFNTLFHVYPTTARKKNFAGLVKRHLAGIYYGYRPLTAWFRITSYNGQIMGLLSDCYSLPFRSILLPSSKRMKDYLKLKLTGLIKLLRNGCFHNWLSALDQYGRSPFRSGNNSKFSTIQTVFWKK